MKKITLYLLLFVFLFSCKQETKQAPETVTVNTTENVVKKDPNATYAKAEFAIDGMTCAIGCAATIEKTLNNKEGIAFAKVDFEKKLAMVEYNTSEVDFTDLALAVTEVSDTYKVYNMKSVEGFGKTETEKKECGLDCKMPCCTDKEKSAMSKCEPNCEKPCCKKA